MSPRATPSRPPAISWPWSRSARPAAGARALARLGSGRGPRRGPRTRHERILADLETEIGRLDQIYDADIDRIAPDDLAQVMESLLDSYRAGNLLGGRLPVVLDGAFDGLGPEARDAAMLVLGRNTDVQSIVVTDDLEVMKSVTAAGGTIVLWPESPDERDLARQRRLVRASQEQ